MTTNDNWLAKLPADLATPAHLASNTPSMEGRSHFFEVSRGWETRVLRDDRKVTTVLTMHHLEEAFGDRTVSTIFVPLESDIKKGNARRLCRQRQEQKTVFFES